MTKKNALLLALVLALAGWSLYLNRDWFQSAPIQISSRSVQPRGWMVRRAASWPANPVVFLLDRPLRLTSVEVVPLADLKTNQFPHPLWQLTANPASAPVKDFIYGLNIRGMKPAFKGAVADPLQPGVTYRVIIRAGSRQAEHDFVPQPRTGP